MFFTRIPCPAWTDHSEEYLQKSRKYFPLVGWIVGGMAALFFLLSALILPISISIILSMMISIWLTDAFHEDGFADVCDGFGGGWTKEQILTIMKDSRVGAYGAIGIGLLLLLKFYALFEIAQIQISLIWLTLINAHASSRWIASLLVHSHEYVQDLDKSKSKPIASLRLSPLEMAYSSVFVWIPMLLFIPNWFLLIALPIAYLPKIYLGYFFQKNIGGYTGDCLGATQQISEVVFYLAILALVKY